MLRKDHHPPKMVLTGILAVPFIL